MNQLLSLMTLVTIETRLGPTPSEESGSGYAQGFCSAPEQMNPATPARCTTSQGSRVYTAGSVDGPEHYGSDKDVNKPFHDADAGYKNKPSHQDSVHIWWAGL